MFSFITINFIIQNLKFFKIAQLFCVSVSLVRGNVRGLRGFFSRKRSPWLGSQKLLTWFNNPCKKEATSSIKGQDGRK